MSVPADIPKSEPAESTADKKADEKTSKPPSPKEDPPEETPSKKPGAEEPPAKKPRRFQPKRPNQDTFTAEAANKIEEAMPGSVKEIERVIYRPNGTEATDLDIELEHHVIEAFKGGGGKTTHVLERTIPNSGGREVILLGKGKISPHMEKELASNGVRSFDNIKELIEYLKASGKYN
jgi:hypothetical protein